MPLAKGDIVLVPFPFTDLSQTKLRVNRSLGKPVSKAPLK
jgi:hypothetical protein